MKFQWFGGRAPDLPLLVVSPRFRRGRFHLAGRGRDFCHEVVVPTAVVVVSPSGAERRSPSSGGTSSKTEPLPRTLPVWLVRTCSSPSCPTPNERTNRLISPFSPPLTTNSRIVHGPSPSAGGRATNSRPRGERNDRLQSPKTYAPSSSETAEPQYTCPPMTASPTDRPRLRCGYSMMGPVSVVPSCSARPDAVSGHRFGDRLGFRASKQCVPSLTFHP